MSCCTIPYHLVAAPYTYPWSHTRTFGVLYPWNTATPRSCGNIPLPLELLHHTHGRCTGTDAGIGAGGTGGTGICNGAGIGAYTCTSAGAGTGIGAGVGAGGTDG